MASASIIHQESSPVAWTDDTTESDVRTLQNEEMVLGLQRRYRAEEEALRINEEECQRTRERLASISAVIKIYKEQSTDST
jgi:hypothetical protein